MVAGQEAPAGAAPGPPPLPFHLYYAVEHAKNEIVILSMWHEKRMPLKL
jgi:hypothetical protein